MSFALMFTLWIVSCIVVVGILLAIYAKQDNILVSKLAKCNQLTVGELKFRLEREKDSATVSLLEFIDGGYELNPLLIFKDKNDNLIIAPVDSIFNMKGSTFIWSA